MDKLFGFVGPLLSGVISPLLGVLRGGIDKLDGGVKTLTELSDGNPKKSGAIGLVLGWLGIDPSAIHTVGAVLGKVSGWLMAF